MVDTSTYRVSYENNYFSILVYRNDFTDTLRTF